MSLFRRPGAERRSISYQDVWGSGGQLQDSKVSPERALRLAPVYAATRLLADSVASLPVHVYRRTGQTRRRVPTPAHLSDPSTIGTRYDWTHRLMTSLLLRGNAYGLRINGGDHIEWVPPEDITIDETNYFAPVYYWKGRPVDRTDLLHVRSYTTAGKTEGLTPLGAFSLAVQLGISASEFGRDWFANRSMPGGVLQNTQQTLTQQQADTIKARWKASVRNGDVFVAGADWNYSAITVTPEDSQLVEQLKLTATQIATVYGVPAEMIGGEAGGSLTYNTVEQNTISFLTHTLRPWLVRLEDALGAAMLPEGLYLKFGTDSMIRTDLGARYGAHRIAREIGLNNIDELRAIEDMPPLPEGQGQDYAPLARPEPVAGGPEADTTTDDPERPGGDE